LLENFDAGDPAGGDRDVPSKFTERSRTLVRFTLYRDPLWLHFHLPA